MSMIFRCAETVLSGLQVVCVRTPPSFPVIVYSMHGRRAVPTAMRSESSARPRRIRAAWGCYKSQTAGQFSAAIAEHACLIAPELRHPHRRVPRRRFQALRLFPPLGNDDGTVVVRMTELLSAMRLAAQTSLPS